jgi:hypothetical protein
LLRQAITEFAKEKSAVGEEGALPATFDENDMPSIHNLT